MQLARQLTLAILIPLCLSASVGVTQEAPGVLIHELDQEARFFVSPGFTVLPNGDYLACVGHQPVVRQESDSGFPVRWFRSSDQGLTWSDLPEQDQEAWSFPFVAGRRLYSMGTNRRFGQLQVRESIDGGQTWSQAAEGKGILTRQPGIHLTPSPFVKYNGRIWRLVSRFTNGQFQCFVISANPQDDLTRADAWSRSNAITLDKSACGDANHRIFHGCVVPLPDDSLGAVLMVTDRNGGKAAVATLRNDGQVLGLDPKDFISMPGGSQLFCVRYDATSQRYYALCNPRQNPFARKNRLELISSSDLRLWSRDQLIIGHHDGTWHSALTPVFQIEGDDLIGVCLTSWVDPKNADRPNQFNFIRVKNFRSRDAIQPLANVTPERMQVAIDRPDLRLNGFKFEVANFAQGEDLCRFFSTKLSKVPDHFQGWQFTRHPGGGAVAVEVVAKQACELWIAVPEDNRPVDLTGFQRQAFRFAYGNESTPMQVYKRMLKAGESIVLPNENWTGTVVLLPPE